MKNHWVKRLLCRLLACVLVLGYLPVPVSADDGCTHRHSGRVTAIAPGTGYVTASVTVNGVPYSARCRVVLYKSDRFSVGTFRITTSDAALNAIDHVEIKDAKLPVCLILILF